MDSAIYLDHNADAPVTPEAWAAYRQASLAYANPSSIHRGGRKAHDVLAQARVDIAASLGSKPHNIVLTSGGTESDALALLGCIATMQSPHVVTTSIEHPAVLANLRLLEARQRISLSVVTPGPSGRIDASDVANALRDDTRLVSVAMASSETGVLQPIKEIANICRERDVLVHTDAVQAAAWCFVDVEALGIQLLSVSGHKLGAVGGIGALFVADGVAFEPVITGGGHENGARSGTENVAGAASLAAALASLAGYSHVPDIRQRRDRFESLLSESISGIAFVGRDAQRLANTACVRFCDCPGDAILMALDIDGVYVSTGSACSSGSIEPSPTLLSMGLTETQSREAVRFSLPRSVTGEELNRVVAQLVPIVARIRASANSA